VNYANEELLFLHDLEDLDLILRRWLRRCNNAKVTPKGSLYKKVECIIFIFTYVYLKVK